MTWTPGTHGSTYGGNPLACAALIETVRLLEDGLVESAARRGEQASVGLRALAERYPGLVIDVRGKGLMIGIGLDSPATAEAVTMACFRRGLLILAAGDQAVRMSLALVVSADEVDAALRIFSEALAEVAAGA